jgi:hypothetical protein
MGVRVTPEMDTINSLPVKADAGVEREPDITFDGSNYVVVWSEGEFGGAHKVRAARVTTQGAVLDSGILYGKDSYLEYRPGIAFGGSRCLAIWYDYQEPFGVFGRFLNDQAQPDSEAFAIRTSNVCHLFQPDIAYAAGRFLVVWNEQTSYAGDEIYGQIIDLAGNLCGGALPIAVGPGFQSNPRVAGNDVFLVVWDENGAIFGQRVSSDGQLIGPEFVISDSTNNDRMSADIAFGADNCLALWMQYTNSSYDIYGNLDINVGMEEFGEVVTQGHSMSATIVRGSIARFLARGYALYDVTGRRIEREPAGRGIYFLRKDGRSCCKIIRID